MAFLIKLGTPITAELPGCPGVVLYVKPCTVPQYRELAELPNWPSTPEEREKTLEVLGRHLDRITGLEVDAGAGGGPRKIETAEHLVDLCPPWALREVLTKIFEVSRLSPGELGNSARPSSGGESTALAGTAVPAVDPG